ncbi:proline dehydrogenase 1, mitochondrial isoform X4 [Lathamus discolor]|uniref:proline dehydrogenase 1, mitochondrial isoform X4 n=1 Tax=Lathamus discolor TaxID=678569 RepID=UPI0032B81187
MGVLYCWAWHLLGQAAVLRGAGQVAEVLPSDGCGAGPGRAGSAGSAAGGREAAGGPGQPRHRDQGRDPVLVHRREPGHKWTPARSQLSAPSTVDLLDWNSLIDSRTKLSKLLLVPNMQTGQLEPLLSCFTEEEDLQMKRMLQRMDVLAKRATEMGVRLMVDAEQSYFQPAISRLTLEMQRRFNRDRAIIFNTYQCYLKEAYDNVTVDVELSRREGWHFGTKLVRGAYMEQERERAAQIGYEDPINPTYEKTNEMYHRCLDYILEEIKHSRKASVMVASHNEDTVKFTLRSGMLPRVLCCLCCSSCRGLACRMMELGIHPSEKKVYFGQLLGMCDQITFPLGLLVTSAPFQAPCAEQAWPHPAAPKLPSPVLDHSLQPLHPSHLHPSFIGTARGAREGGEVRLASLSTSMCPMGRCRRCCPTSPAVPRKTGVSWSGQTGSGTFSGGRSSGGSLMAPSLVPATNPNCASSPAPLVPSPMTTTAIPQPSPAAVALPAPFSRGGDMSLLLFELKHLLEVTTVGLPQGMSPLSQGLDLGCLRGRVV